MAAEASHLAVSVSPKQMGKHLREVRRRKGLSLSEVARGAGLSRRELVAYERGKVAIPESDLWVLAGSCGVDPSELVPTSSTPQLAPGPSSMGETVAQLRRAQDDAGLAPHLGTLTRLQALPPGKKVPVKERELEEIATALGREPKVIEDRLRRVLSVSPEEAARLREIILPPVGGPHRPRAIAPAPAFNEMTADGPVHVDVFEELARLPEPLPLPDTAAPLPDLLATPAVPDGVELVDGVATAAVGATGLGVAAATTSAAMPPADAGPTGRSAADAPPIDVATRQSSDAWADWGKVPTAPPLERRDRGTEAGAPAWQPPPPDDGAGALPPAFWETTDDWTPSPEAPAPDGAVRPADGPSLVFDEAWTANHWPAELAGEPGSSTIADPDGYEAPWAVADTGWAGADAAPAQLPDVDASPDLDATATQWPAAPTGSTWNAAGVDDVAAPPGPLDFGGGLADEGAAWSHEPDPEAVSTGFYVDWGDDDATTDAPAWQTLLGPDPDAVGWNDAPRSDGSTSPADTLDPHPADRITPDDVAFAAAPPLTLVPDLGPDLGPDLDPDVLVGPEPELEVLPLISWRADGTYRSAPTGASGAPAAAADAAPSTAPAVLPEEFVVAGPEWQLGNALPLVEVQGEGALVMRRADERWALADVLTPRDLVVEVDVEFRSGPGFGVLFRADVDGDGRMSGYSFDVDPIYDGGGYLVRQWLADRELWNPIARVVSADPQAMHGALTVRLVVHGEQLVASVNGTEVLTVEHLADASRERGRDAATGDRVGVQAWSSSDLVIETLRVAAR